jgi:hypothetical protein
VFITSFTNEDFSANQIVDKTLAFSNNLITAAIRQNITGKDIKRVRSAIPASIVLKVKEYLVKCGIKKGH